MQYVAISEILRKFYVYAERRNNLDRLPSEKKVDYTHLRDLLKALNWEKADEETHLVMLKASGREEEGWLNVKSMNNFPCTDLQTIDKLWVKYTTGRLTYRKAWRSRLLDCRLQECDRLSTVAFTSQPQN